MTTWLQNRRSVVLAASSTAVLLLVGILRRGRRRGAQNRHDSSSVQLRRSGSLGRGASIEQQPCPVVWQQIQQRDWLFGLPPEIADAILARLDVQDLKALRATCRQTYLQVAARTRKLVLALDASPRTWRLASQPRLDSVYPVLRELHLILAADRDRDAWGCDTVAAAAAAAAALLPPGLRDAAGPGSALGSGFAGAAASVLPGAATPGSAMALAHAAPAKGGRARWLCGGRSCKQQLHLSGSGSSGGGGGGGASSSNSSTGGTGGGGGRGGLPSSASAPSLALALASRGPRTGPEHLRHFLSWSANGHLHHLTLLDLSRCPGVPLHRDTWEALVSALGPGEVTLRVAWRCLLAVQHGSSSGADRAGGSGASGSGGGSGGGGSGGGGGSAAAAKAAAAAAAAAALTSPFSLPDGVGGSGQSFLPHQHHHHSLSPLPPAPPPRCTCSICGPCPPDVGPVVSALQVLAKLRPSCSVELEGRGVPVRNAATLQALCALSQLASVSLAVCGGVRPLAHQAGWFSCLRRLHSLELRYREEPGGDVALHQILRALQGPVPLRSLVLHRQPAPAPGIAAGGGGGGAAAAAAGPGPGPAASGMLLDEADFAALAALTGLRSLDAPGLRIHAPTQVVMPGLTRLALRSDKLELAQPLAALFPGLEHLELGHGAGDLPATAVLTAAAAPPPHGLVGVGMRLGWLAPAGPVAVAAGVAGGVGGGGVWAEVEPVMLPPAPAAPLLPGVVAGMGPAAAAAAAGAADMGLAEGPAAEILEQPLPLPPPQQLVNGALGPHPLVHAHLLQQQVLPFLNPPHPHLQNHHPHPHPHQHQHLQNHHPQQPSPSQLPPELTLHLRLLQGLSGLRVLSIGGKPGHGVEALSTLTALSSLILVRCSEFRPLRKAVEELRGLTELRSLELHACLGGDACGYEIARLLRRLQKLPNLARLVIRGCDPRLPQQLATAPLGRLAELQLLGLPELQPLDLRYVVQAQTACRRLVVRGCSRLGRRLVEALPALAQRPQLAVEWAAS